jgi:hypothetical protein
VIDELVWYPNGLSPPTMCISVIQSSQDRAETETETGMSSIMKFHHRLAEIAGYRDRDRHRGMGGERVKDPIVLTFCDNTIQALRELIEPILSAELFIAVRLIDCSSCPIREWCVDVEETEPEESQHAHIVGLGLELRLVTIPLWSADSAIVMRHATAFTIEKGRDMS